MKININVREQLDDLGFDIKFLLAHYVKRDKDLHYILECRYNDNFYNNTEYTINTRYTIDNYSHTQTTLLDANSDIQHDFENVDEVFEYFVKLISENENIKKEDILKCNNFYERIKDFKRTQA